MLEMTKEESAMTKEKKLLTHNSFVSLWRKYKNHTIYLGLATMAFYPELEQICKNNGIAIIKQAGDTIVINDEHLKAF